MNATVWGDIPEEDRGFMADWYQAVDELEARTVARAVVPPPPELREAAQVVDQAGERQTYLDKLRQYLVDSAGLDAIPEPSPLIDHVLYLDTLAWIIGRPGSGKSFVALDWAGHIGSGLSWCGFPTTEGPVLYVSPESPGGVKLRVRAWELANRQQMRNVFFLPLAVQASVAGHWQALIELCGEIHPLLVILDTQARMSVGMDENSAADMGVFIDKVERLRAATRACVLVVHHTSRGTTHLRGSTALEGAASTIVTVSKADGYVVVGADPDEGGKTKDVEPFERLTLRMVPVGKSVVLSELGAGQRPENQITPGMVEKLQEWWEAHGTDPISVSTIESCEYFPSKRTFYRAKKALTDRGLLREEGAGRTKRYGLTRLPD